VRYIGFDTDRKHIAYARRRFGKRGEFHCALLSRDHLPDLPPVHAIALLGLLHHLDDESCAELLRTCEEALAPGGRVLSVDPCFEPGQGRVSRWMSTNGRGGHVRPPAEYVGIAQESFVDVQGEVLAGVTRIPSSFWLMRMRTPAHAPVNS
jgi:SAM-dependent methyltransferase